MKHKNKEKSSQKKWTTFTYFSSMIRRITNLFKDTNIIIAFKTTNTIQQQLSKENINRTNPNGYTNYSATHVTGCILDKQVDR